METKKKKNLDNEKQKEHEESKKIQQKDIPKKFKSPWLVLDAGLFFILILICSIVLIMVSGETKDSTYYYTRYPETDEYIEDTMQVVLSSTVPHVAYYDYKNSKTEFVDYTIEHLIIIDLTIRDGDFEDLNASSLEHSLENEILTILNSAIGENRNFIFTVSLESESDGVQNISNSIFISNTDIPPHGVNQLEPSYEKHITYSSYDQIDSGCDKIVIRLYFT